MTYFYLKIVETSETGELGYVIHTLTPCNLKCPHCFNRDTLTNNRNKLTIQEIINKLKLLPKRKHLILSGNEFLNNDVIELENILTLIKKELPDYAVIVYTNGMHPVLLKMFYDKDLINGFQVDLKIPLVNLDETEVFKLYQSITGLTEKLDIYEYLINVLKSCELAKYYSKRDNNRLIGIRTVDMPQFDSKCRKVMQQLEKKYDNYKVNKFYNLNTGGLFYEKSV